MSVHEVTGILSWSGGTTLSFINFSFSNHNLHKEVSCFASENMCSYLLFYVQQGVGKVLRVLKTYY